MGQEPFGNGIRRPFHAVDSALYRLRIVNGSNARIFRLARSDGRPVVLIGNDGGLLDAPVTLSSVDVAPAERVDLLVDLGQAAVGDRIMLQSIPFAIPGGMGFIGGANLQGNPLDLLELRVTRRVQESVSLPGAFTPVPRPDPGQSVRERTFRFTSAMMGHRINGRSFDMERIDEQVPFGVTEIWTFVNDSTLPHPVHLHATHFRVLSRTGGRGAVMPWEGGLKDTVLLLPTETVRVVVRFTAQRGSLPPPLPQPGARGHGHDGQHPCGVSRTRFGAPPAVFKDGRWDHSRGTGPSPFVLEAITLPRCYTCHPKLIPCNDLPGIRPGWDLRRSVRLP